MAGRVAVAVALLGLAAELWLTMAHRLLEIPYGADLRIYLAATERLLAGQGFYLPHQLAGPYTVVVGDVLYPPFAVYLFGPFLVLPAVFWWLIPISITVAVCAWHRPGLPAVAAMIALLALPNSVPLITSGNPVMWVAAAVAVATIHRWVAILVLIKPSLAPLSLIGVRDRRWWLGLAVLLAAALPFGSLWIDYGAVLVNGRLSLLYSLGDLPLVLIPIAAWLGGRHRPAIAGWRRLRQRMRGSTTVDATS